MFRFLIALVLGGVQAPVKLAWKPQINVPIPFSVHETVDSRPERIEFLASLTPRSVGADTSTAKITFNRDGYTVDYRYCGDELVGRYETRIITFLVSDLKLGAARYQLGCLWDDRNDGNLVKCTVGLTYPSKNFPGVTVSHHNLYLRDGAGEIGETSP